MIDDAPAFNTQTSLGLQALIWPTLPGRGSQIILSQEDPESEAGFRLYLDSEGAAAFKITQKEGKSQGISSGIPLISERWHLISGNYDVENGTLTVVQKLLKPYPKVNVACKVSRNVSANMICADIEAPIMIAARSATNQPAIEHFSGRIEAPKIFLRSLGTEEMENFVDTECEEYCCRLGLLRWDIQLSKSLTNQVTNYMAIWSTFQREEYVVMCGTEANIAGKKNRNTMPQSISMMTTSTTAPGNQILNSDCQITFPVGYMPFTFIAEARNTTYPFRFALPVAQRPHR